MLPIPKIYLRSHVNEVDPCISFLVHEAAHSWHFIKDLVDNFRFSVGWYEQFPNERNGRSTDDPDFVEESGILVPYAAINYWIDNDRILKPNKPEGKPNLSYVSHEGRRVDVFAPENYSTAANSLLEQAANLPGNLRYAVMDIGLFPGLNIYGLCDPDLRSACNLYSVVTEDIATHTAHFHAAANFPARYQGIVEKINNNPLTRKRLEVLVDEGFLDDDTLKLIM